MPLVNGSLLSGNAAATVNFGNGFEKTRAWLVTSERCRQLEGVRSHWITNEDSRGQNSHLSCTLAFLFCSESWCELQADDWQGGADQRSTFNSIRKRDLWKAKLRKQYLGKEWKIGNQHFSLMLSAATVTHRGVPGTLCLVCISLSPSISLVRSAAQHHSWHFLWTWVFLDLIIKAIHQIYIGVSSFVSFIPLINCRVYQFGKCCASCHTFLLHDFTPCTFRFVISFFSKADMLVNTVTITNGKGWTTARVKLRFQKPPKEMRWHMKNNYPG